MWFRTLLDSLKLRSVRALPGQTRRDAARSRSLTTRPRLEALEDRWLLSQFSILQIPLSPEDINSHGQVVGYATHDSGGNQAALWQNGVMINLGSLAGPLGNSRAIAINDAGQIVGQDTSPLNLPLNLGFIITPEDTDQDGAPDRWYRDDNQDGTNDLMTPLPLLPNDINNAGLVVGGTYTSGVPAVLWRNGSLVDLGGGYNSFAFGINDAGQVVGEARGNAFLLTPKDTDADGIADCWFQDTNNDGANDLIVTLVESEWGSSANAINASGQVVGWEGFAGDHWAGFLWTPSEPNGNSGSLEYLTLDQSLDDLNASGNLASGHYTTWGWTTQLIPSDSGWTEVSARAINDSDWIVGSGDLGYFLMKPTGEDQTTPFISIGDVTVTEGDTGTTAAVFTVSLSAAPTAPITVDFSTADDTATSGSDYQATSGVLNFNPGGPLSQTITVLVNGDRLADYFDEYFFVNLSNPTSARIADGQGIGTIRDNEPRVTVNSTQVTEGNTGTTNAVFTVTMLTASAGPVDVAWSTANVSATAGSDYQAASGMLTFNPGAPLSQTVTVTVNGDRLAEASECFTVRLSTGSLGLGYILNDEPIIRISGAELTEGNTGTRAATFTVSLAAAYDLDVTLAYAAVDNTAVAGSDYVATSGTLTFAPGQTVKTITVPVIGDRLFEQSLHTYYTGGDYEYTSVMEDNETFFVYLSNITCGSLADDYDYPTVGTIGDDDPRISISDVTITEGHSGTRPADFTVRLSAPYDVNVTVAYATANSSAGAGSDYQAVSGTVTFTPGQTSRTISVPVIGDRVGEPNEYFVVNLGGPNFGAAIDGQGVGTIMDDEPRISISDVSKKEGKKSQTTLFTFTVTLSAANDQPVTMSFRTLDGTAKASEDYVAKTGTLTFNPGQTSKTITIDVKGDTKKEANETFTLELFGASSNAQLLDAFGLGLILNDD